MSARSHRTLYDRDVVSWAAEQMSALAALGASGVASDVDWPNVIRTIGRVAEEELARVKQAVSDVLGSAIKGYIDPDSTIRLRWEIAALEGGFRIRDDARPSVRSRLDLDQLWVEAFDAALPEVRADLIAGVPPGLPTRCPFSWDDLLDENFTYESAVRRLYDGLKLQAESGQR